MSSWLPDLRHDLHQHPELAGCEEETSHRLREVGERIHPTRALNDLGGHGLAWIFEGERPGPTVMLRADMDAVPVPDQGEHGHRSTVPGISHACGHDGHMAILSGLAARIAEHPIVRGRLVCLFQPAEENGTGALAVLQDARFDAIRPDTVFALHNLPGFNTGDIILRSGTCCCASRGMQVTLHGIPAHAAYPETGLSPLRAMRKILEAFDTITTPAGAKQALTYLTIVGAHLGEKAFGTAPGDAEIYATLRSESEAGMADLTSRVETIAKTVADEEGLARGIVYEDVFPATANSETAVALARQAATGLTIVEPAAAFRWSEDFGHFTARFGGALIGLGAGSETAPLHTPRYDFPDELIPGAIDLLSRIVTLALV